MHRREVDDEPCLRDAAPEGTLRAGHDVCRRRDGSRRGAGAHVMSTSTTARGASWLLEAHDLSTLLIPERLSDEHRMIAQTAREFTTKEVIPAIGHLEQKDWSV